MDNEPIASITFACGHSGSVVERCAKAYRQRYCDECALTQLPKPSDCLREFDKEHGNCNHFGPMLGPIGAVIYARQSYFGINGQVAWSGTEDMHKALEGFESTRHVKPYIEQFELMGI